MNANNKRPYVPNLADYDLSAEDEQQFHKDKRIAIEQSIVHLTQDKSLRRAIQDSLISAEERERHTKIRQQYFSYMFETITMCGDYRDTNYGGQFLAANRDTVRPVVWECNMQLLRALLANVMPGDVTKAIHLKQVYDMGGFSALLELCIYGVADTCINAKLDSSNPLKPCKHSRTALEQLRATKGLTPIQCIEIARLILRNRSTESDLLQALDSASFPMLTQDANNPTIGEVDEMHRGLAIAWEILRAIREDGPGPAGVKEAPSYIANRLCVSYIRNKHIERLEGRSKSQVMLKDPYVLSLWLQATHSPDAFCPVHCYPEFIEGRLDFKWNPIHTMIAECFKVVMCISLALVESISVVNTYFALMSTDFKQRILARFIFGLCLNASKIPGIIAIGKDAVLNHSLELREEMIAKVWKSLPFFVG